MSVSSPNPDPLSAQPPSGQTSLPPEQVANPRYLLGFWSAVVATTLGFIYFVVILAAILTGKFVFPPGEGLQLFGGIISLVTCPVLVVLMACLHAATPPSRQANSLAGLALTSLFAVTVSINRFAQLGVVRQSAALGEVEAIQWFLAYGERSILFAMEILGWGWFLGLAMLVAAPLFAQRGYQGWLRWLMVLYGVFGLVSAVGQLLASPLIMIGFLAWGVVLYGVTALLAVHFWRAGTHRRGRRREIV